MGANVWKKSSILWIGTVLTAGGLYNLFQSNLSVKSRTLTLAVQPKGSSYTLQLSHQELATLREESPKRKKKRKRTPPTLSAMDLNRSKPLVVINTTKKFRFPSVAERVEYYMGDWYHERAINRTKLCQELTLFSLAEHLPDKKYADLELLVRPDFANNAAKVKPTNGYWPNLSKLLRPSTNVAVRLGDKHRGSPHPIWQKARTLGAEADPSYLKPILVLLVEFRHYQRQLATVDSEDCAWKKKKSRLVWRGIDTGNRTQFVRRVFDQNTKGIDVAFNNLKRRPGYDESLENYVRSGLTVQEQLQHKYLLSLQGNDVATGLKWMLYSNSVVFMPPPTVVSWAMEDKLVPYVHFIPVAPDGSDLAEKVAWAQSHDKECQEIAQQATKYMQDLYMSEKAQKDRAEIHRQLLRRYRNQYGRALDSCLES